MFVTVESPIFISNTVGVEYIFELFNPAGIVGLMEDFLLQRCNPYRDFQGIFILLQFYSNKLSVN